VSKGIKALLIHSVVVRVQMLSELEEVISYKDHMDEPERQATQRATWQKRYACCLGDVLIPDWMDVNAMSKSGSVSSSSAPWS